MEIQIQNNSGLSPDKLTSIEIRLKRILEDLVCPPEAELSVLITGDEEIAELNQRYLNRHGPTNVIAFPQQEGELAGLTPGLLGDVVVSLETARREAAENGLDGGEHLIRLLIHGLLHLLGHDHVHNEDEARAMEELTEKLLSDSVGPDKEGV
jgi:probable rRNA maturation factor